MEMNGSLYMVVERFRPGMRDAVYARFAERGRMLPDGLEYLDSWVEEDGDRCFQLMAASDRSLLSRWARNWSDLVEFEFVPVKMSPTKTGCGDPAPDSEGG